MARLVLVLTCAALACTDAPAAALDVSLRFSPTPPSLGPTRFLFELTDSLGTPVTGASIHVAGRPAKEPTRPTDSVRAQEEGDGRYVVGAFGFDVSGQWILNVQARTPEGLALKREFEISVYGGPGEAPGL